MSNFSVRVPVNYKIIEGRTPVLFNGRAMSWGDFSEYCVSLLGGTLPRRRDTAYNAGSDLYFDGVGVSVKTGLYCLSSAIRRDERGAASFASCVEEYRATTASSMAAYVMESEGAEGRAVDVFFMDIDTFCNSVYAQCQQVQDAPGGRWKIKHNFRNKEKANASFRRWWVANVGE